VGPIEITKRIEPAAAGQHDMKMGAKNSMYANPMVAANGKR
jgi:hypothetical protein